MLLRVGFQNFLSFAEYTEISMVSLSWKDQPNFRHPSPHTKYGILPVMGLFGANASGKTNALLALKRLKEEVQHSFLKRQPNEKIDTDQFLLGTETNPATQLDCDFVIDGVRYHYGFIFTQERFVEEWFYVWPKKHRQVWFDRKWENDQEDWYFGSHFKGSKQLVQELTRPNSLFLSIAAQVQTFQQLQPLLQAFHQIQFGDRIDQGIADEIPIYSKQAPILDPKLREFVISIMQAADLGIVGIQEETEPFRLLEGAMEGQFVKAEANQALTQWVRDKVMLCLEHQGSNGQRKVLTPHQESKGTLVWLVRINHLLPILLGGGVLLLDEVDRSLHPELVATFLQLFLNPEINTEQAQLIFTSHEESILNELRRDEVLFVEKDETGRSSIIPLSEFQTRERDDIEQAYRNEHFGARPQTQEWDKFITGKKTEDVDG